MTTGLKFSDDMTLEEARAVLRTLVNDGHECPVCRQYAKVYRRSLPSASARVLIALYRQHLYRQGDLSEYVYLPPLLETLTGTAAQGGYGTLSVHWELIQRQPGVRDDGSDRVGWWRLTPPGVAFVQGKVTVPKYAVLYNGRCLRLDGKPLNIVQALGKKFNYAELMRGV